MKPHARDYIFPAIAVVFLLNLLFVWVTNNMAPEIAYFAQFFTVLVEVGVTSYATIKFVSASNKYDRNQNTNKSNNASTANRNENPNNPKNPQ